MSPIDSYVPRYQIFQCVPQDPTDGMLKAGVDALEYTEEDEKSAALRVWIQMVDAATKECPDANVLTQVKFGMYLSFIAKIASQWAGETLTEYRYLNREMDAATVARFTDEMRGRLDSLDGLVGRASQKKAGLPHE